jgi:hypothetical protein
MTSPPPLIKKKSPSKYMNKKKPDFYCGLYRLPEFWTLILTVDCSVYLTRRIDLFCLPNLDTLIFAFEVRGARGGCDQLAWDAYLSYAPDPTSGISGDPC